MRSFLLILLTVMAFACTAPVMAQDDVLPVVPAEEAMTPKDVLDRKNYSEEYYSRCMAQDLPEISEDTQDQTCMCHMVHMIRYLKTPEIETMGTGKGKVTVNPKRLLPYVYAPCIEFQVEEVERENCYDSTFIKEVVSTQNAYDGACDCVTEGIVEMVRETAQPQLEMLMSMNPAVNDVYATITGSAEYSRERQKIYTKCINLYGGR